MNVIESEHQLGVTRRRIQQLEETLKIMGESPPKSLQQEWVSLEIVSGLEETLSQLRQQVQTYLESHGDS